jgi:glycosyltransferase involved in cell wall biosynthesis
VRVAFVTVGDTNRLTGGYLYNARVLTGLRERDVMVEEIVPCGASSAEQEEASRHAFLDPRSFDVVVVDALARIVCAPHLDRWREEHPVVAMVHELPSAATQGTVTDLEREREEGLLRSNLLICVSEHGRLVLEGRGVPAARIRVVPPGFDRFTIQDGKPPRARGDVVRALCVAQWIPRKGILDLVRAWTLHERPGAVLDLVGEADADPAYARRVNAALQSSITVRGPVDDAALAIAYASAELFVLPSRYEGYGMVYAEALSYGLPIIACNVGPVPELVGKQAALLVSPGDVEALSVALDLLTGDAT